LITVVGVPDAGQKSIGFICRIKRRTLHWYVTELEDMANLFLAIQALRAQAWIPKSVRDIRAFRIEQWSDFARVVKS